ncbi:MAG: hypothetical protein JO247_07250, partial [Chloroflexi bacterium]|nr:hypothetical protein [Chloroflexota bacterium]
YARLTANSQYAGWQVPSGTNVIGQNVTMKPQDNKMVRQAMNYALDRKRIVQTVYQNIGDTEDLPWLPNSVAYEAAKNTTYPFDMDKAKALLAQAGLAAGSAFDIVITSSSIEAAALAQIMQSALTQLGITLNIKPYDTASYLDQINNHKYHGLYIGAIAYAAMEPVTIIANSRHLDPTGNSNTGYTSPQYLQLYNSAAVEPDASKRKALYSQLNDLFLDESAVMPIVSAPARLLTRNTVHDIGLSMHGAFLYNDAWIG